MSFPRASGVLLHPTSLPGLYGLGDLGPAAFEFIDLLASGRQRIWQVLPLGPTAVAVPVKLAALVGFLVLLRMTGVVSADELERVRGLLGGMLRLRPAQA